MQEISVIKQVGDTGKRTISSLNIPGIDPETGLLYFDNDIELYMVILYSYVKNTPAVIDRIRIVNQGSLNDYAICVHTLKSSSRSIGANGVADMAERLEVLAKEGNLAMVMALNGGFIADVEDLLGGLSVWIEG